MAEPTLSLDIAMRKALMEPGRHAVDTYTESLDAFRFPQAQIEGEIVALLTKKYATTHIDAVVAVGATSLDFAEKHRSRLWPEARILFQLVPRESLDNKRLSPTTTGIPVQYDVAGTVELALALQPTTRRLVVIYGSGDFDRAAADIARKQIARFSQRLNTEYWTDVSIDEVLRRIGQLGANDAVLYLTLARDADGRMFRARDVLGHLASASPAPIYGPFEPWIGLGSVAGSVYTYEARGKRMAELVQQALSAPGASIPLIAMGPPSCIADARRLKHFGMAESSLPPGCDIRFADRPFWRQYWWQIVVTLAIIAAQAMLIAMLIVQRRQRRLAQIEVQHQRTELAHASRLTTLGQLSASIAHEVNQPLGAISGNVDAVEMLLDADPPKLDDARRVLHDLKVANQRASDVVLRIRKLLRKRELEFEPYDVNGAASDIVRLLDTDAVRRSVEIRTEFGSLPVVNGDRLHFQQVLLNLLMNGMEAMAATPVERRHLTVRTGRNEDGDVEIAVTDTGPGIDACDLPHLFDSFFTKKKDGMGLGLALCRSLVQAHGGRIWVQNNPGGGATFTFALPVDADRRVHGKTLQATPRNSRA